MNPTVGFNIICFAVGAFIAAIICLPWGGQVNEDRFRERCITATAIIREKPNSDKTIMLNGCNAIADKVWGSY
jgi:hypothetical protein